jgi:acyl-CoA reductase-like NAD-dependent aldehyde dehydrogenase
MSILRLEPFIDGSFIKTSDPSTDIDSPLTLKPYAQMVEASKQSVELAVQSAQQAFLKHRRSTLAQRVDWLNAAAKGLEQALPELIDNLIHDIGKPKKASSFEANRSVAFLKATAAEALTLRGETIPVDASPNGLLTRRSICSCKK